ncbi:MAG: HAD-IA family hydrolase [Myxococcota bacterium]
MAEAITVDALVDRYEHLLLDAYGVLVDGAGPLPGAPAFLQELERRGVGYTIVTNDASRLPATIAARFASFGLRVAPDHILTSGSLLAPHFATRGLEGARCVVLGTPDSVAYVTGAGGEVVALASDVDFEVLVVADDAGYPFLEGIETALSAAHHNLRRGRKLELLLPNPDLIYPKRAGQFGLTSGMVARVLELGLARLFPRAEHRFTVLGKPEPTLFLHGRQLAQTDRVVMIGDQLETDIVGAKAAEIEAALYTEGVSAAAVDDPRPDFVLTSLAFGS